MAYKQKHTKSSFPFKSPLKNGDKLSEKTVKKYKEKGISIEELKALNVTPSDTVLTIAHPDLGESDAYLVDEARYDSKGKINPNVIDTRVHKTNKGYKRYSKFKKN